jgi:dTDP-4-amino-4,6-dideoxygalactose transaminase
MNWLEIGNKYGWRITLIIAIIWAIAQGLWRTRQYWLGWIGIKFRIAEKEAEAKRQQLEQEAESRRRQAEQEFEAKLQRLEEEARATRDFQEQIQQRILLDVEDKNKLFKWVQDLYKDSIREDRLSRNIGQQFVDVMTQTLEVIDAFSKRLDRNTEALIGLEKVVGQAWFVLAKVRKSRGDEEESILGE